MTERPNIEALYSLKHFKPSVWEYFGYIKKKLASHMLLSHPLPLQQYFVLLSINVRIITIQILGDIMQPEHTTS